MVTASPRLSPHKLLLILYGWAVRPMSNCSSSPHFGGKLLASQRNLPVSLGFYWQKSQGWTCIEYIFRYDKENRDF